jgi:hypothetical protein
MKLGANEKQVTERKQPSIAESKQVSFSEDPKRQKSEPLRKIRKRIRTMARSGISKRKTVNQS